MLKIDENCVNVSNHFGIQDFNVHVNQITCSLCFNLSLSRHPILEGRDGAPGAKGVDMLGNTCSHYLCYLPIIRTEEFPRQLFQLPFDLVQVTGQRERRAKAARARAGSSGHIGP